MNNGLNLVKMAKELLTIHEDFLFHSKHIETNIEDFTMETFIQTWMNTSGGFEEIGGSAITEQRTYVFIPISPTDEYCQVYFGDRFAYSVPVLDVFLEDVRSQSVAGCKHKNKYI